MSANVPGGPIRWRMHLPVAPDVVFAALDSAEGREAFWAESAPEENGTVRFAFINGVRYDGRVLHREPPTLWAVDYFGSEARFELAPDGAGGTDLLLTHRDVPAEEWHEVHAGWLNVLFPLKAWLAFGVDLRSHDPERSWDHGYADP